MLRFTAPVLYRGHRVTRRSNTALVETRKSGSAKKEAPPRPGSRGSLESRSVAYSTDDSNRQKAHQHQWEGQGLINRCHATVRVDIRDESDVVDRVPREWFSIEIEFASIVTRRIITGDNELGIFDGSHYERKLIADIEDKICGGQIPGDQVAVQYVPQTENLFIKQLADRWNAAGDDREIQ